MYILSNITDNNNYVQSNFNVTTVRTNVLPFPVKFLVLLDYLISAGNAVLTKLQQFLVNLQQLFYAFFSLKIKSDVYSYG